MIGRSSTWYERAATAKLTATSAAMVSNSPQSVYWPNTITIGQCHRYSP